MFALVGLAALAACERAEPVPEAAAPPDPFPTLRAFEAAQRAATDFAALPPSNHRFGSDPHAIAKLPGGDRFVALLRGEDRVAVLDASLRVVARLAAPASPTGLAVTPEGHVLVSGETEPAIRRYAVLEGPPFLEPAGSIALPSGTIVRDVAVGPEGVVYAADEPGGRLFVLGQEAPPVTLSIGHGPIRVARVGRFLIVDCLLDHTLVIHTVDAGGIPVEANEVRIHHDGPIWSFDAVPSGDGLLLAAGGVEDHPLDRTGGFFGYIDSFVHLYRITGGKAERIAAENVSSLGVITPKALAMTERDGGAIAVNVTGYGGDRMAKLVFREGEAEPVTRASHPLVPGSRAFVTLPGGGLAIANPLLDAFVLAGERGATIVPVAPEPPAALASVESRLGEALFFTHLMAPGNGTEGAHSRFTCETCHFEGHVDGRIHHTGRGDVRVVTKPLLGLFNNRPHFSRALDPDLSSVAHNEFRVAGAGSGQDPWFRLDPEAHPVLGALGVTSPVEPVDLRRALMRFLMEFTHRTNPKAAGRASFSAVEAKGAAIFRDRCERCHAARLTAEDAASRVPFERWESLVFSPGGPIVWASDEYQKTGVVPYVHDKGARVPSLRRLARKWPYLTSGAAKDLDEVLSRVRWGSEGAFFHDGAREGEGLGADEREALRAFLDLL
ncbi:hypothetical protein E8A73_025560 [Polyangium aurulentum]|nr:hypothetical protein E8A73_025560 [Polyangium aurulentum]